VEFTEEQAEAHNALFRAASEILVSHAVIAGRPTPSAPDTLVRRQLEQGIQLFSEALQINPEGWPSMWGLGKLYQRLGDNSTALKWFVAAHQVNPDQPDILREAGIAALSLGAKEEALRLCFAAVRIAPDDLGLQANLALAFLIGGDDEHAEECASVAVSRDPQDAVSRAVLSLVQEVRQGRRPRPDRIDPPGAGA